MKSSSKRDALLLALHERGRRAASLVSTPVSRRKFLAASASAPFANAAAQAAEFCGDCPTFLLTGRALRVAYRGKVWEIDAARFGAGAKVSWLEKNRVFHITLLRATFAGTGLSCEFQARIWNNGTGWKIAVDEIAGRKNQAELQGLFDSPSLQDWIDGNHWLEVGIRGPVRAGAATIEAASGVLPLRWNAELAPKWRGRTYIKLAGAVIIAQGGQFQPAVRASPLLAASARGTVSTVTRISFEEPTLQDQAVRIATLVSGHSMHWRSATPTLDLEAFASDGRHEALVTLGGAGSFGFKGPGLLAAGLTLPLERSLLSGMSTQWRERSSLAFTISRTAFFVESQAGSASLQGDGVPVSMEVEQRRLADLIVRLTILQAHVPVSGASKAAVECFGAPATLQFGGSPKQAGGCDVFLHLSTRPSFQMALDNMTLLLKRSADMFDLRFEFRNYRLEIIDGKSRLYQRWAFDAGCSVNPNPPTLIAVFPPQHVQEEVFTRPDKLPGQKAAPLAGGKRQLDKLRLPFELARTAPSAPTRIALQTVEPRDQAALLKGVELTIESITDWHDLTLAVHERALPQEPPLLDQLSASGLTQNTSRANAKRQILTRLTSSPGADQTSIEAVTGLIVSPDRYAKFVTPRNAPLAGEASELWSARMELPEKSTVRALHARGANFDFLAERCGLGETELHDFPASMSASDRAQLVVLMTAYGLPSLRRLQRDQSNGSQLADDPKGMVFRPPIALAFLSDAKLGYEVPAIGGTGQSSIDVLQEGILHPRGYQQFDLTLSALRGSLVSRWEGQPPAPLPKHPSYPDLPFFPSALDLEGYIHRTVGGRDALVQVSYKGFLFPLGHRAALIKISERPFLPARWNAENLEPTAYLIQRHYIVCRKPVKVFPAIGQPHGGRDLPAANVEMVTLVTPDILDINDARYKLEGIDLAQFAGGKVPELPGVPAPSCDSRERPPPTQLGRVFWPRTRAGESAGDGTPNRYGYEVQFDYRIDGEPQPMRSPLVFVDNTAAHDASTMQALVSYYEALDSRNLLKPNPPPADSRPPVGAEAKNALRIAVTGGVMRKYAPADKAGQTSFNTEYWVLGASGGVGTDKSLLPPAQPPLKKLFSIPPAVAQYASFTMDALMEGADQPPFYPRLARAYIKMQSLDRLLGRPQGLIEVGPSGAYVVHALNRASNPAEIFLDVLDPPIDLDVTNQGDAAGGVAKPNSRLAAISRSNGMIGGVRLAAPPARVKLLAAPGKAAIPAGVAQAELTYDTSSAKAGTFKAAEFLGGAADSLLLGIIPMRDVINVVAIAFAPKLQETFEYASDFLLEAVPELAKGIRSAMAAVVDAGNGAARKLLGSEQITNPLQEFYPAVFAKLARLDAVCAQFGQLRGAQLKQELPGLVAQLSEAGKDVIHGMEALAADPLPQSFKDYVQQLRAIKELLESLASPAKFKDKVLDMVIEPARKMMAGQLAVLMGKGTQPGAFDVAFGIALAPDIVAARAALVLEIIDHPRDAADRLRESLFSEILAGPLLAAWADVIDLRDSVRGLVPWARPALAKEVASMIARADSFLSELGPIVQAAAGFADRIGAVIANKDAARLLVDGVDAALLSMLRDLDAEAQAFPTIANQALAAARTLALAEESTFRKNVDAQLELAQNAALPMGQRQAAEAELVRLEREFGKWKHIAGMVNHDLDDLKAALVKCLEDELRRQLHLLAERLRVAAQEQLTQIAGQLVEGVLATLQTCGRAVNVARQSLIMKTGDWCKTPGTAANLLAGVSELVRRVGPELTDALAAATKVRDASLEWTLPPELPAEQRAQAQALLSGTRRTLSQAIEWGQQLQRGVAGEDALALANPCDKPELTARAMRALSYLVAARLNLMDDYLGAMTELARWGAMTSATPALRMRAAMAAPADICAQLAEGISALSKLLALTDARLADVLVHLDEIDRALGNDGTPQSLAALAKTAQGRANDLAAGLDKLARNCAKGAAQLSELAEGLRLIRADVVGYIGGLEKKLIASATQALVCQLMSPDALAVAGTAVKELVPLLKGAIEIYDGLLGEPGKGGMRGLLSKLKPAKPGDGDTVAELLAILTRPGIDALDSAAVLLERDKVLLSAVSSSLAANPWLPANVVASVDALASQWRTDEVGLVGAVNILGRLIESVMRGQFSGLFDFGGLRKIIEEKLLALVPTKITQKYDYDTRIEQFPASDPVFQINRSPSAGLPLAKIKNDLVLKTTVEIDLVKNKRRVSTLGQIRPFNIRLLGTRLDLVTIKFKGAEFSADTGSASRFNADIDSVEIGALLEFIKALQQFFGPKEGNGPYVSLQMFPPEIEAGYKYSSPLIPLGTLLILNVGISVSMHLPFDNRQAYFKFAFCSAEWPFLIVQMPYGGGGFVGLLASAKGIIGFEIQFEFGAVVALKFGPLNGQGRVTAGIYLYSGPDSRVLEGFVNAVGEGSVGCFGVCVNIAVRVRQQDGGSMVGSSTYSLSFKVGFAEIKYAFTAQYKVQGGGGGGTARDGGADGQEAAQFAARGSLEKPQTISTTMPRKHKRWGEYRKHMDI